MKTMRAIFFCLAELWRRVSGRDDKWQIVVRETMISLMPQPADDCISLESHSQLIITLWLNLDVLRLRRAITTNFLPATNQHGKMQKIKNFLIFSKLLKSPSKLIKFLFVALGHRRDPDKEWDEECFETIFIAISLLKRSLFCALASFEKLSKNFLNTSLLSIVKGFCFCVMITLWSAQSERINY